jgi:hypothetical protein
MAARPPHPHRHRHQQHVAQRVGDRDQPLGQEQVGHAHVGPDQEHPGQQADPGGDDGGVDQADHVAAGGQLADQQQQPGGQQDVAGQVEGVGHRRVGRLDLQHPLVGVVDGVADGEGELAGGQQVPGQRFGRPVEAGPDDHGDHHAETEGAVHDRPQERVGQPEIGDAEQELDGEEDASWPSHHGLSIGRSGGELLRPSRGVRHLGIRPQMTA